MMKKLRVIVFTLGLTVALIGCGKKGVQEETQKEPETQKQEVETESESESETETEQLTDGVYSYLTGELVSEEIGRKRPIAVMLNNIIDGVPQAGIENASVVYEAPVEGNYTRLMGIFEDYKDLEKIGSVRSSRLYYVSYAMEFEAIYVHYGQAYYALTLLDRDDVYNLNGMDGSVGSQVFYRTQDRVAPHNAYTSSQGIEKGMEIKNYSDEYSSSYSGHYNFASVDAEINLDGEVANTVKPGYTVNKPWFEYDEDDQLYYRFQYDDKQVDELTDHQLAYKNIILQYSPWRNADENGYLEIDTVAEGEGKYITNGKAIDITWKKDDEFGITKYYDSFGQEIAMNTGKTWVCIIQDTKIDHVEITE